MKRRDWLQITAAMTASSLFLKPSVSLAKKIIENALSAAPSASAPRNYVQINLYGAPSRWGFDSILRPYDDCAFVPNRLLGNRVRQDATDPSKIEFEYATAKQFDINMPPAWSQNLHIGGAASMPMSVLMQNALFIRGCRLDFEGHPLNGMQQVAPVPGGLSIHGAVADAANTLFSSVSLGDNPVSRCYKSNHSPLTEIPIAENNYVEYLMRPFLIEESKRFFNLKNLEADFDELAKTYDGPGKKLADLKKTTLKNLKPNIDQYIAEYSGYMAKYLQIFSAAFKDSSTAPKITTPRLPLTVDGKKSIEDALGVFSFVTTFYNEPDLATFLQSGKVNFWAQEFALTEFLLKNNICSSILLSPQKETGYIVTNCSSLLSVNYSDLESVYDSAKNKSSIQLKAQKSFQYSSLDLMMDSHKSGIAYELVATSLFFKGLSSCLLELIQSLKSSKRGHLNLFDETVIHLASEFDRVPDPDARGSSHYPLSNPTAIFSGCIKKPVLIGNIYTGESENEKNKYSYGTVGTGAPVKELGAPISISHVSSTLSTLLRIPPIVKRAPSLIEASDNTYVSAVERSKNIEGSNL